MKTSGVLMATAALTALLMSGAGAAATKNSKPTATKPKPVAAAAAPAADPVVATKRGPSAPQAVKLRQTTAAEAEANAVWNIRAALNIAALQCQFLPFLATVKTYNDILRHHSEELNQARLTMLDHFKRYDGAKAQTSFDQYTTKTYNSFSTIDAQIPFCEEAGIVGREILSLPKGGFGKAALRLNPEIRASLEPGVGLPKSLIIVDIAPRPLPEFGA
ncbi:hypothetical protein EUV02_10485 [Polymorphobacter arshaanensis]|uniref:Uncharacterized protein n=1 Tax=Glacieibacterium arshaanense TaxID=2511025 RepID=A0A4Y9ENG5_9SPHN|nr:hypothetical protein [Polymorphobacter arshaanensis]TFU03577.1 hypothetical protein EUV02_10485 [Polymorphobacter arshaanensis]